MRYKVIQLAMAALVVVSASSCGLFRKGCKCPPVRRHMVASAKQPIPALPGFGNGDRTHPGSPAFQQRAGAGL